MKKHHDASELAARLAAAASQPPGITPRQEAEEVKTQPAPELAPKKMPRVNAKPKGKTEQEENTVPISLRPGKSLLDRYVIAASERTRETGRVISAQQIMLEILERGI
jgi:hypothetical protein